VLVRRLAGLAGLIVLVSVSAVGCSASSTTEATAPTGSGAEACPTDPVRVVVTVDQWGDIVDALTGGCARVTTIINSTAGDPHDYEPTPADNVAFSKAALVVMNGLSYDHWAEDALDTLSSKPAVVNGGDVVGRADGDNPHLWYSPTYVREVADAVTSELQSLAPAASDYFGAQAAAWNASMSAYDGEIAAIRQQHPGATYAATEPVFAYMADALGLEDRTPSGYVNSAANESEPAPGDISAFEEVLKARQVDVLIYNTQTEGTVTDQLRSIAEGARVSVVEVTETVPPGQSSFVDWQLGQLQALSTALSS
jgi:zinc/manganese transport system substrate-binding protein